MNLPSEFIHHLKPRFLGELRLDSASKALYATDASAYQIEPLGVAIPKTQEDLQAAVELAAKYKIPILPRGSGSSLAGQAIGNALILDCSRYLDSILEIDPETHSALVEPGVVLANLNRAAAKHGLMFGPDPASAERATLGGVIGNNATGAHSIQYGMSADHLISADVLMSDGSPETFDYSTFHTPPTNTRLTQLIEVVKNIREDYTLPIRQHYPKSWRNSAGYRLNYMLPWSPSSPPQWDKNNYGLPTSVYHPSSAINMAHLLAGSEGTLAVFRRLRLNLVPKPKHTVLGVLSYASIAKACDDVPRLLAMQPSAVELIPQLILRNARSIPAYARQMSWVIGDPAAVLVIEFSGDQLSTLKEALHQLGDVLAVAETIEDQARIWNIRKVGLGILDSTPTTARPIAFIEDCAIPVESLGQFVREIEKILEEHGTFGGIYAHASAGCLHIRPVLNLQHGTGVRTMRSIVEQVFVLTMSLGGSMSSEHGDGLARGEFIKRTYGMQVTEAMHKVKNAADPDNLLNPKKMLTAPAMDENLRYGAEYRVTVWDSKLTFERERGLAGAIESCNGQGVCRKMTGVMCPSFQATRDEANSTRGRANLLRALITFPQTEKNIIERPAFAALDLCLACKGCTAECPSGVDMPKLKYEFMNHYYQTHNRPLRDYLFGYFHITASILSKFASLANLMMQTHWLRRLIAQVLSVTPERPFPKFSRPQKIMQGKLQASPNQVILLSDVFSHYIEPEIEQAAINILTMLGYQVHILPIIGAGASLLSKGFLEGARRHAHLVLTEIEKIDNGVGLHIVGCEPPEIYCIKHEYGALLPEQKQKLEMLSSRVWLVDEFILRIANKSRMDIIKKYTKKIKEQKLTLHPHCHQRAEAPAADGLPTGMFATQALLTHFGYDVEILEAGCCGMAGTFGYDAEHYELSMKVGELGVLPKVRNLKEGGLLSTGAACRMQIYQGAGVQAIQPLVLISNLLSESTE